MHSPPLPDPSPATSALLASQVRPRRPGRSARGHADRVDWGALVPRTFYARRLRGVVNATLGIALLLPALAIGLPIAVANLCLFRDPRLILFVQPRVGLRGRVFSIYKFRTMSACAARGAHPVLDGERQRVTRFGRFLRNTHMDELPQVLNVLKRDMDVIGPRPEMVEIERWAALEVPGFGTRLAIRPGITGSAQITQGYTGQEVAAYAEKLAINLEYMRTMSLLGDVEIVVRTAVWMVRGRGSRTRARLAGAVRPGDPG